MFKELEAKIAEIREKIKTSESADEVRSLGEALEQAKKDLADAKAKMEKEQRDSIPEGAEVRGGNPIASYGAVKREVEEKMENMELRKAFKSYIMEGGEIPKELRATTKTSDVAATIPTYLVDRIIEKMDNVGEILGRVTRTSFAGGMQIPKSSVKPTASWVAEGAGSTAQKKTVIPISFTYNKLRCEIAVTMEVATMSIAAFEAKFVENVAKAMVKAIEDAIINGDGSGKPKGILAETAPTGQAITVAKGALSYKKLVEVEAAVPAEYENTAVWLMSKKSFMAFIGLTDTNGQPIARTNFGMGGKPERTLLGREVVINDYVATFDAATANTFAFIYDLADYDLNTIYDMGIKKEQDWDTEDMKTKAVMSVDGKCLSVDSLVTLSNTL